MAQYTVMVNGGTLTTAATKSLILLNPATVPFRVFQISVSLDNVTTDAEPVQFDLYRVVTIGSAAGTTSTPTPLDETDPATAQTTALTTLTTEPTTVTVIDGWYVTPHSGLFVVQFPLGREPKAKGAGARIGLRYVTASGVTPKANATLYFEE